MKKLTLILALIFSVGISFAHAQGIQQCYTTNGTNCIAVGTQTPAPITGNTNVTSYSAAVHNLSNSSAGDIYCIGGSDTKIVKVKGIRISAIASAAVNSAVSLIRRSSADSGGGAASVTITPNDTNNPAATATVTSFTSAPTAGTSVGTIRSQKLPIGTATSTGISPAPALFQFSVYWDQPQVLRGSTQFLCVDVDSTAGGNWEIDHEHTEE